MSGLRERLEALRRETGTAAPAPVVGDGATALGRRLDRLRRARRPMGAGRDEAGLAARLGGDVLAPGLVRVRARHRLQAVQGGSGIGRERMQRALDAFPETAGARIDEVVFLDTETSGLAGGSGTAVFLVGLARLDGDALAVDQLLMTGFGGEAAMLEAYAERIGGACRVATFNGRTFDAPLLATRARLAGMADPLADRPHLDLLHPLRRAYAERWPDCRLATAEERLLAFRREGDLPGSQAPEAWFAWMRAGEWGPLRQVVDHNRLDLLSLAALLARLAECLADPVQFGANPLCHRPTAGSADPEESLYRYLHRHRGRLEPRAALALAAMARRRGEWEVALAEWDRLAAQRHPEATERLAKYHEHVARDPARALELAAALRQLAPGDDRHRHREQRLRRKLAPPRV